MSETPNQELLKILIIDDDQVDRLAVRRALTQTDFQIAFTEAAGYDEAIAIFEFQIKHKQGFDCIFLDYQLPGRDGAALIDAIHHLNIFVPIVVLTGQGDEQIAVKLMKSGVTDYLPKSQISPKTLGKIVQNALLVHQAITRAALADQRLHQSHSLLVAKNKELRILEEQQQDFITHLTHDLKTPIVAADLMLKLFQKEAFCPLSAEMHNALAALVRSNQNLLDIVNTLLEVHCYESGAKELTLISFDLWQIAQEIIIELQPLANEKGILLTLEAIADCSTDQFKIVGDCLEIRRMLTNLVGNSIKFTDMGYVELSLGLLKEATEDLSESSSENPPNSKQDSSVPRLTENTSVIIQVKDSGIGMTKSEQQSLFQRFRKGSHKQSGSGLGLHLVDRIVTVHGGTIAVTSESGHGSIFTIHLPQKQPAQQSI